MTQRRGLGVGMGVVKRSRASAGPKSEKVGDDDVNCCRQGGRRGLPRGTATGDAMQEYDDRPAPYALTPEGRSLEPVIAELIRWGALHGYRPAG